MAIYVTKKCPHCGFVYQNRDSGDQRRYGSPLITCGCCNHSFWDKDIKEPALYGFENLHELVGVIRWIINVTVYLTMGVIIFIAGISLIPESPLLGIVCFLSAVVIFGYCLSGIKKTIFILKHKDEFVMRLQKKYDESMARLQDDEYLQMLAKYDCRAKKVLKQRMSGEIESYAKRP